MKKVFLLVTTLMLSQIGPVTVMAAESAQIERSLGDPTKEDFGFYSGVDSENQPCKVSLYEWGMTSYQPGDLARDVIVNFSNKRTFELYFRSVLDGRGFMEKNSLYPDPYAKPDESIWLYSHFEPNAKFRAVDSIFKWVMTMPSEASLDLKNNRSLIIYTPKKQLECRNLKKLSSSYFVLTALNKIAPLVAKSRAERMVICDAEYTSDCADHKARWAQVAGLVFDAKKLAEADDGAGAILKMRQIQNTLHPIYEGEYLENDYFTMLVSELESFEEILPGVTHSAYCSSYHYF